MFPNVRQIFHRFSDVVVLCRCVTLQKSVKVGGFAIFTGNANKSAQLGSYTQT